MNGGIDSQIQQAQMSAGNNPQALAQRYQQTRSLVDLLALQKLKSDKENAARDIQMKMQQQPQTIIDQREQELMGATKKELMDKMAPTLQRTGAQSAQMAQSGIAQNAPPMGMRTGGIVPNFQEGGQVADDQIDPRVGQSEEEIRDKIRTLIKQLGVAQTRQFFDGKPAFERIVNEEATKTNLAGSVAPYKLTGAPQLEQPEGIASIVPDNKQDGKKETSVLSDIGAIATKLHPGLRGIAALKEAGKMAKNVWDTAGQYGPTVGEAVGAIYGGMTGNPSDPLLDMTEKREPIYDNSAAMEAYANLEAAAADKSPQLEAMRRLEEVASKGAPAIQESAQSDVNNSGIANVNTVPTDSNREELMRMAMESARIDPNNQGLKELALRQKLSQQAQDMADAQRQQTLARKALADQYNDPEKQRREKLNAFLLGAGNRSNFGSVMAGGLAGAMNAQKRNEREALNAEDALAIATQQDYENMKGIGDTAYDAYSKGRGSAAEEKRVGMQSATNMSNNDLSAQVDRENAKLRAETNAILREGQDYSRLQARLADATARKSEIQQIVDEKLSMNPTYTELKKQWLQDVAKNRTEKATAKRAQLDAMEADALGPLADSLRSFNDQINMLYKKMGLQSSGSGGSGFKYLGTE